MVKGEVIGFNDDVECIIVGYVSQGDRHFLFPHAIIIVDRKLYSVHIESLYDIDENG